METGNATEVAQVISGLVRQHRAVPDEVADELRRLLAYDLGSRHTARLRLGHLRLLLEMLAARDDGERFVTSAEYEVERKRRALLGEQYPDESTLRRAYGHWFKVVRAAAGFLDRGGAARVKHSHASAHRQQRYDVQAIQAALLRCHHALAASSGNDESAWPTEWEYEEWAAAQRLLAREHPRLPVAKPIRKAFGSFAAAVEVTRASYEVVSLALV
jgi:hypothetical protein